MSGPTTDDYRWLTSDQAAACLNAPADRDPLKLIERLRRQLPPTRAQLVAQQLELRRRAARKFSRADRMLFTPRGVEQATGEAVARHKALRFANRGAVADLCCGVGGDLIGLACRTMGSSTAVETVGVDSDPAMAIIADANAQAYDATIRTLCSDVRTLDVRPFDAWHIDPDRRSNGARTTDVARYAPNLAELNELLAHNANGAIKLAPAVEVPDEWSAMAEVEWISHDRECRQAVAWFGSLVVGGPSGGLGTRRATRLDRDGRVHTFVGHADQPLETTSRIGRFVLEPDAAVLAAQLGGDFACHHNLYAFASSLAYLTADQAVDDPLLACFEVTDVLPYDARKVKRLLQSRGIGRVEVKKRGVALDPNKIARQLTNAGDGQATLLLAKVRGSVTAILADRYQPTPGV